ncbi:MAG TPA: LuxR C-terminal-related transcriptional regulator [Candidatus Dormibacteraeota bacterium]|nr:LuxR C-terminal-related transcriptional regulator [Candidatus Dormibacteraeota bacterium]
MDQRRKLHSNYTRASRFSVHPKAFVFFDKGSGTRRFEVKASEDGRMPQEQAVNLLAMHCVARQQLPKDFSVMIAAGEDLVEGLAGRAMKLIRACSGSETQLPLTQRQNEVLACIAQNLSNKEIAAKLNITERTVKFHVSILLGKYRVRRRVDLMLEAFNFPEAIRRREAGHQRSSAKEFAPSHAVNENSRRHLMPPTEARVGW